MSFQTKEIYDFSLFRLDVSERRLTRNGRVIKLADKAFDTLCVLVRRHGELVTKDELMSAVWPDAVVEENNLDQKISLLRGVLGERGKRKEKFIETVRGHGYRFVATVENAAPPETDRANAGSNKRPDSNPVTPARSSYPLRSKSSGNVVAVAAWQRTSEVEQSPSSASAEIDTQRNAGPPAVVSEPAATGRRQMLLPTALAAGILIGVIAVSWAIIWSPTSQLSTSGQIRSIAILPFVNETGDPENDFLSDGLTDSLIGSVSQIPDLAVRARSSVFRFKGPDIDPTVAGKELSTQAVLTGRFTRMGADLAIGLELIEVNSGNVLWAERFERRASEIPQLQSEIASEVAAHLRSRLSTADEQRIAKVHTTDPEASAYFLQGLYHLNKRSAQDIRTSIALFQRAAIEDPAYSKAYAATALAHIILPDYSAGMTRDDIRRAEQSFREAFLRARDLDDTLPEVHVLAAINCELEWNIPCAEQSYRRAIELDPNFALARHVSSRLYGATGRSGEALEQIYKARDLDPFSVSIAFNLASRLADARRYDEAIQQYKRVLEMEPNHSLTHLALAMAYDAKGLYRNAITEYKLAWVLLEKLSDAEAARKAAELTKGLEASGPQGYWEKRLDHANADLTAGTGQRIRIAACLARLGRDDEALEELERSWADREPDLLWVRTEQAFDSFLDDQRYTDLLRRIGVLSGQPSIIAK